jgi:hypothetical protein
LPTDPTSLAALAALSVPAAKLIDAVRGAIGLAYAPTHVRRMAKAEADAAVIGAEGAIRVDDVRERARLRFDSRAVRQQENIEAIVRGAVPELPESVSADPVDPDWIAEFFQQCENVSDEQMRTLWSKILAGEVAQPGRYGKRTLEAVRLLHKVEAASFTRLCAYVWMGDKEGIIPLVNAKYLEEKQIYYATFLHFASIGFLTVGIAISRVIHHGSSLDLDYHGRVFTLTPHPEPRTEPYPSFPAAFLTPVGIELAFISGADGDPAFPAVVTDALRGYGIDAVDKEPAKPNAESTTPTPHPKP